MLEELRKKIDEINTQLVVLLGRRLEVAKEIAQIKKREQFPILDSNREDLIKEKIRNLAREQGLSAPVIEEIFQLVLDYTRMEMEVV